MVEEKEEVNGVVQTVQRWKPAHWLKRGRRSKDVVARVPFMVPRSGDVFYLRMLLHVVRGAQS